MPTTTHDPRSVEASIYLYVVSADHFADGHPDMHVSMLGTKTGNAVTSTHAIATSHIYRPAREMPRRRIARRGPVQ